MALSVCFSPLFRLISGSSCMSAPAPLNKDQKKNQAADSCLLLIRLHYLMGKPHMSPHF